MILKHRRFERINGHRFAVWIILLGVVVATTLSSFVRPAMALPTEPDWISSEPKVVSSEAVVGSSGDEFLDNTRNTCQIQTVSYVADINMQVPVQRKMCVVEGDGFRIVIGKDLRNSENLGISFGVGTNFYRLNYLGQNDGYEMVFLPNSQKYMWVENNWREAYLNIYDNLLKSVKRNIGGWFEVDLASTTPIWRSNRSVSGWGVSDNGQYVVYGTPPQYSTYAYPYVIFRENIMTGEVQKIGPSHYVFVAYPMYPPQIKISDDGSTIISSGAGGVKFWKVNQACLSSPDVESFYHEKCPTRTYFPSISPWGYQYPDNMGLSVNADWSELSYYHNINGQSVREKITIRASNIEPNSGLDYLALGDSYSSGEGDLKNGYMDGTEGENGCHLSASSYPFLLKKQWDVLDGKMASVACSGAKINPDYVAGMKGYLGQGSRIKGEANITSVQDQALSKFTPGIVPQLEFVKKYKPSVVTLTGGGNDAGFAEVLRYCASPQIGQSNTCSYADGGESLDSLKATIYNQYTSMTNLISKIRNSSPLTKVYIVGYPQFVAEHGKFGCGLNAAMLNQSEIETIRKMVVEMNDVLWLVAKDTGVQFVDIENSLDGGQICGGGKYMTGLWDVGLSKQNRSAMFHPNSLGHSQMATSIRQKVNNFGDDVSVSITRNAKSASEYISSPTSARVDLVKGVSYKDSKMNISASPTSFGPNTVVTTTVFSEPVELGETMATDDGGLTAEFDIPDAVGAGEHLLTLKGQSYTGEPLTLYQFITVGVRENDIDGDGILDSDDRCQFVTEWFDEETGVDICKEPVANEPDNPPRPGDGTNQGNDSGDNSSDDKPTFIQKIKRAIQTMVSNIKSAISSLFTFMKISAKLRLPW